MASGDQRDSDQTCTAVVDDAAARPNPLFTPPCSCSRCAPGRLYERTSDDDGWLRIVGHQQRYRVEVVELGACGRAILG